MYFRNSINHITLTEYRPQGNLAEKYIRNLKTALIAYLAKNQTSCLIAISYISYGWSHMIHDDRKIYPGSNIPLIPHTTKGTIHSIPKLFTYSPSHPLSTKWKVRELLLQSKENPKQKRSLRKKARENLYNNVQKSSKYYNQNRREPTYRVGDLVMYRTHPTSSAANNLKSKLCYKWTGPYEIKRFLTPVTVALFDPHTNNFIRRSHVSQVKIHTKHRVNKRNENRNLT